MIGNYVIQRHLGEGSYGVVKLAKHQQTGRKVAIKISSEEDILGEFNILKSLYHLHIVQPIELVQIPNELKTKPTHDRGMVMEYLDGGDLIEFIERHRKLPEKVAMKYLYQILSALNYCHKMGIAHRDIKPDNLLLDSKTGNLVLADFGLAAHYHPNQYLQGNVGSALYAAPEVLQGAPYIGPEVDIWSAGVVFYCMLTSCIPWEGHSIEQQLQRAVAGNYYKLNNVSRDCANLIAAMLSVDSIKRPTADDLLRQLSVALYSYETPIALSPSSSQHSDGEFSDIGSCGSLLSFETGEPTQAPFSPSIHDIRTISAKELKSNNYLLVYFDMEVLFHALELAFASLSITTTRICKKKSWINTPCVKYECKYGQLKWELEICKMRDYESNTKILLYRIVKGDASTIKTLMGFVYNKYPHL